MADTLQAPYFPIIYVRGFAMSETERDETSADPFCGFNMGSTVYRAAADKGAPPRKFVFESPMLRLASDYHYEDVYENGNDVLDPGWEPKRGQVGIASRSVIVYRYYDSGSALLGDGRVRPITEYATGLGELILKVKALVQQREGAAAPFKCYLVAHSMGGLVVRAFLQNRALGTQEARDAVDKVFTYATPHNGIEMLGVNVPGWMPAQMDTFNRKDMAGYLALGDAFERYQRVDFVPQSAFPIDRFFCMVGTNRMDYGVAKGLSRTFVGNGSDGLVKIANAAVWGLDDQNQVTQPCPVAFAYRSHSGFFGIVNAEESYQNLVRFLFGDVRVDLWLEVDEVRLPPAIADKKVSALYQFELLARPRGKRWYLSRRLSEEDSPACRTHAELTDTNKAPRLIYLSTVFLANSAKVSANPNDRTLAYLMDVRVRVPDYEVDKKFWLDQHYEGGNLFSDALLVVLEPPAEPGGDWVVRHSWQSNSVGEASQTLTYQQIVDGKIRIEVPLPSPPSSPGIQAKVVLIASAWR